MNETLTPSQEFEPSLRTLEAYADVVITSLRRTDENGIISEGVQPGDKILILFPREALRFVAIIAQKIEKAGGELIFQKDLPMAVMLARHIDEEDVRKSSLTLINSIAATATHFLDIAAIQDIPDEFYPYDTSRFDLVGRAIRSGFGDAIAKQIMSSRVKVYIPTEHHAHLHGVTLEELWTDLSQCLFLDTENPVAKLAESDKEVKENTERLNRLDIKKVHIKSDSGDTDVTFNLAPDSVWVGASGANRPSFESFTTPDCNTVNGYITFDTPVNFGSQTFSGLKVFYKDGHAYKILGPDGNEDHPEAVAFRELMAKNNNFDMLGEFALTPKKNARMKKGYGVIMWTENLAGFHVAHGSAYPKNHKNMLSGMSNEERNALGYNKSTAHFDLVRTGNFTVTATLADGTNLDIFADGNFTEQFYLQSLSTE